MSCSTREGFRERRASLIAEEAVKRKGRAPLTRVPCIRLTRETAVLGNSGWNARQLGCTEASHGASALAKMWSKG
jgi:hypothetical protein